MMSRHIVAEGQATEEESTFFTFTPDQQYPITTAYPATDPTFPNNSSFPAKSNDQQFPPDIVTTTSYDLNTPAFAPTSTAPHMLNSAISALVQNNAIANAIADAVRTAVVHSQIQEHSMNQEQIIAQQQAHINAQQEQILANDNAAKLNALNSLMNDQIQHQQSGFSGTSSNGASITLMNDSSYPSTSSLNSMQHQQSSYSSSPSNGPSLSRQHQHSSFDPTAPLNSSLNTLMNEQIHQSSFPSTASSSVTLPLNMVMNEQIQHHQSPFSSTASSSNPPSDSLSAMMNVQYTQPLQPHLPIPQQQSQHQTFTQVLSTSPNSPSPLLPPQMQQQSFSEISSSNTTITPVAVQQRQSNSLVSLLNEQYSQPQMGMEIQGQQIGAQIQSQMQPQQLQTQNFSSILSTTSPITTPTNPLASLMNEQFKNSQQQSFANAMSSSPSNSASPASQLDTLTNILSEQFSQIQQSPITTPAAVTPPEPMQFTFTSQSILSMNTRVESNSQSDNCLLPSPLVNTPNPIITSLIASASPMSSPVESKFGSMDMSDTTSESGSNLYLVDSCSNGAPDLSELELEITSDAFDSAANPSDVFERSVFALATICRNKLYKPAYRTQAQYGLARWKLTATRVCQILGCDVVLRTLSQFTQRPDNEKVCRMLISCAKNSAFTIIDIWEGALAKCADKVSTTIIQQVYKELLNPPGALLELDSVIEFNVPSNLVEAVTSFLGGVISFDPLWNESSFTNPKVKFTEKDKGRDPLNVSWVDPTSLSTSCFLPLVCGTRRYDFAEDYFAKLIKEIGCGHVSEAIVFLKYDLSIAWIRSALSEYSVIFLYPVSLTSVARKRKISHTRKKRVNSALSAGGVGTCDSYCLLYHGVRSHAFYRCFGEFGLAPGLNCPSFQ